MNPRCPPFTLDLYIKNLTSSQKYQIEQYIKSRIKQIIIIKDSVLLEGCKLYSDLLEPEFGMNPSDWPCPYSISYRGGLQYFPPYGYMGFGLKVLDSYDYGDNTWLGHINKEGEFAVAYHGIRSDINDVNQIVNSYLKEGQNQNCENDEDLLRPGYICGRGVYVTPSIEVAEYYTRPFYVDEINQSFRIVFQCRVDPTRIRISKRKADFWIFNGNGQEIRPYRLLIKKE